LEGKKALLQPIGAIYCHRHWILSSSIYAYLCF